MSDDLRIKEIGMERSRVEGALKVTGRAPYAMEHGAGHGVQEPLHAFLVGSTVSRGRVLAVHADEVRGSEDVVAVLDHTNAPRLADTDDEEYAVLQDDEVHFRGQVVALVLATTSEAAREGARRVRVEYAAEPGEHVFDEDSEGDEPEKLNAGLPPSGSTGEPDLALASATHVLDETYRTPYMHNNPMEPHATTALWDLGPDGAELRCFDSTQAAHSVRSTLARLFGIEAGRVHVEASHVGGGFGSKGLPHAHNVVAVLAARSQPGRWVRLAVTRQQMFALTGYRTATISRFRLGAGPDGVLGVISHDVVEQTSRCKEFAEQTVAPTRHVYAAPNRRTSTRLVRLDVAVPSWMRAPGEMPGSFAQEAAMDELADLVGLDPIELRRRNEPEADPETGKSFGDRRLLECFDRGAERFGWSERGPARSRLEGDWYVGLGTAASVYPAYTQPGNQARVLAEPGGYRVEIGAVDIGTGARTVLRQIAADALDVDLDAIDLRLGSSDLPIASVAGGSSGTSSWGWAIVAASRTFRAQHGTSPEPGDESVAGPPKKPVDEDYALHSFGAQFVEARVNRFTGEVRVPRMLGVFSVGRVVNPKLARSQLVGGMTMGLSTALFEESWRDPRFGHVVTDDLATYHVATHADVRDIEAAWLDESDHRANPMGLRGIGEIGITGAGAAVASAVTNATGVRQRSIPVTPDKALGWE
ncbi:xanthine dehydrogenase family protein molybdopterin-binding subunit [uncultured Nocardioides sp.]|uniref:xanthine dehydrogenase family protein molybdopterin-binding subunit n=1 Tax=uncultured Nocardioides sp. TaxID=198441 RepID=UPI0025E928B9|nr:xanthine dehydrogenase family protein molybdopterin-binding subunit [uncultured Nocardioides sp.]